MTTSQNAATRLQRARSGVGVGGSGRPARGRNPDRRADSTDLLRADHPVRRTPGTDQRVSTRRRRVPVGSRWVADLRGRVRRPRELRHRPHVGVVLEGNPVHAHLHDRRGLRVVVAGSRVRAAAAHTNSRQRCCSRCCCCSPGWFPSWCRRRPGTGSSPRHKVRSRACWDCSASRTCCSSPTRHSPRSRSASSRCGSASPS